MKIGLGMASVGLAMTLAAPSFAQQTAIADPAILTQLAAHSKGWDQAFNNNSAAAMVALYTKDAVEVTNQGPIYGRDAIEKHYEDLLKQFQFSNHQGRVLHSYPIGTDGKAVWSDGEYSFTAEDKGGHVFPVKGYWSSITVLVGNVWKDRMQTWNVVPTPGPTPAPAAVPSNQ